MNIETYLDLYRFFAARQDVKGYLDCLKKVHEKLQTIIREKAKIKIAFQIACIAEWIGDELVQYFANDDRFEVMVVLTWQQNTDREYELGMMEHHFRHSGLPYVIADGRVKPRDFDIIFYTSPYMFELDHWLDRDIFLSSLVCYVPYGYCLARIHTTQFNQFAHCICWKKYALTKAEIPMARRYCAIGDYGMVYSGYPKLDGFLERGLEDEVHWKIAGDPQRVKKIIYAPHHSINEIPYHSTFPENYKFLYEYAASHPETTSWVFKPHPLLRISCVRNGIFSSVEEFDAYARAWDDLPNGKTVTGDYLSWFASSDAMIFDSLSFMAEYLFVHKPSLYLTRGETQFNEFGDIIFHTLYQAQGNDYDQMAAFIEHGIDADPKKIERDIIFEALLDYATEHGMSATKFIYEDITRSLL